VARLLQGPLQVCECQGTTVLFEQSKLSKVKVIAVRSLTCLNATGTHVPYRITQCYLPLDRGDIPAFTPNESRYSIKRPRRDARLS